MRFYLLTINTKMEQGGKINKLELELKKHIKYYVEIRKIKNIYAIVNGYYLYNLARLNKNDISREDLHKKIVDIIYSENIKL